MSSKHAQKYIGTVCKIISNHSVDDDGCFIGYIVDTEYIKVLRWPKKKRLI